MILRKNLYREAAATLFSLLLIFVSVGSACTTFVIKHNNLLAFGRNLDWKTGVGLVIVNKRNIQKTSIVFPPEKTVSWVSKYGSITFNQVGKEVPYGGINETGLVVEEMTLRQTEYPPPDDRPAASELQWIQYQLDNQSTIQEVINSDSVLRIGQADANIHFLVADKMGNVATIEFL